MSRAKELIEKMSAKFVRPNSADPSEYEYACDEPVDKEPTSWRSIISNPTMKNVRANTGRGHKQNDKS